MGPDSVWWCPMRGNEHKLEQRRFIRIWGGSLLWRWLHRNRLPRKFPTLEIFKTHLDTLLCSILQGICFSGGLHKVIPRSPSNSYNSVTSKYSLYINYGYNKIRIVEAKNIWSCREATSLSVFTKMTKKKLWVIKIISWKFCNNIPCGYTLEILLKVV